MNQLGLRMLTKGLILAGAMDVAQQRKVGLAPFGTMALDRVFDSLRDNFNDVAVIPQPAVVVRTETD